MNFYIDGVYVLVGVLLIISLILFIKDLLADKRPVKIRTGIRVFVVEEIKGEHTWRAGVGTEFFVECEKGGWIDYEVDSGSLHILHRINFKRTTMHTFAPDGWVKVERIPTEYYGVR